MKSSRTRVRRVASLAVLATVVVTSTVVGAAGAASTATQTFTGSVSFGGPKFVTHVIDVTSAGVITGELDWTDAGANLQLQLKDPSGSLVAKSFTKNKPERITFDATVTGKYRFGVKAASGASAYTLAATYPGGGATVVAPTHHSTIGGPGHADMYPSGGDVDATGTLYVADTGDDQVQAYGSDGRLLWAQGDDGPKALGRFDNPRDVAVLNGSVYVADTGYRRVQVLDAATGAPQTAWQATFKTILGISAGVDGAGNAVVLVTESSSTAGPSSRVMVFTPAGSLVRVIGSGPGSGDGQLREPRDAATDSNGNVYVADYENDRMAKFSPTGTWLLNWGVKGGDPGQFRRPYGVDVDDVDRVYVADSNNNRIQRFTTSAGYIDSIGSPTDLFMLRRVAVGAGSAPAVYAADLWGVRYQRYDSSTGNLTRTYGGAPPPTGLFNEPYGMAIDGSNVFVIDTTNQRAQRFGLGGDFQLDWGERGWGEGNPGFNWALDITIDAAHGTVWVADTKNYRLTEFSRDGLPTGRVLGRFRGSTVGSFDWPHAVVAADGDLFVADTNNGRVQRWELDAPGGVPTLVWEASGFNFPKDLAVHSGAVYVADSLNAQIVRLSAATGAREDAFGSGTLHRVEGVAVEPNGDVWASDTSWNRLVEFNASGAVLQRFGSAGTAHGRFSYPAHLEISGGRLYVADVWNDRIEVFTIS